MSQNSMKIDIERQIACQHENKVPSIAQMQEWAYITFTTANYHKDCSFTARFVDKEEIHELNLQYRNMDKPTNILSFPYEAPEELFNLTQITTTPPNQEEFLEPKNIELASCNHNEELIELQTENYLGDLVICMEVLETEALEQNKSFLEHSAHLIVHGCLHLLGFDHITEDEAQEMEGLEIEILAKLGYANPYE